MNDPTTILNRTGLTLGFVGSLFLAVGILGPERIRRFEDSSRQTLGILVNPLNFIKTSHAVERPPWVLLMLLPLSLLFYALPAIMGKHLGSVPVVSTVWSWFRWNWGLPDWLHLVVLLPAIMLSIFFMRRLRSKSPARHWWLFSIPVFILALYIGPAIPFIVLWFPCWFILLLLTSVVLWTVTLPIQLGFAFQRRLGLSSAFEPAGVVLLALAFLLQLIGTF